MSDTMITIASGTLIDYTVSLTRGVIDPTLRWIDSLGSTTDRRHQRTLPIDEVDAYMTAHDVDKKTAICAIVKADLATLADVAVDAFTVTITPHTTEQSA